MFSDRLKKARNAKDLTQQAVADYLGITVKAYQHYEYHIRKPTCESLIKLCQLLEVSSDYLLGLPENELNKIDKPAETFITVLGSSGCKYDYGNDTASFLINNKVIVDTGWNLVENLLDLKLNPAKFNTILFTHLHHDHYLALPQFLFYHLNEGKSLNDLTFIGPEDLNMVVKLAIDYLQAPRFYPNAGYPNCIEIKAGENIVLDDKELFIETHKSIHPVDGRYYRVTDQVTGVKIGFSGDTAYSPGEISFFKNCDLLIHECSLGGKHTGDNSYLHADAADAANIAKEANVKKLALVHYRAKARTECFNAAANIFKGEILTPIKGDVIYL